MIIGSSTRFQAVGGAWQDLLDYVSAQGLHSNFAGYDMRGVTGATVPASGGLTSNSMTLVGSPTLGADGVEFNGVDQYGSISDFIGAQTLTVFARADISIGSGTTIFSQYHATTNDRSWLLNQLSSTWRMIRSSDGSSSNFEVYDATKSGTGSDNTFVAQWVDGSGRGLWINKSAYSLSLAVGSAQTSRFNTARDVSFAAREDNGFVSSYTEMTATCFIVVVGALTTSERETMTDLINAL